LSARGRAPLRPAAQRVVRRGGTPIVKAESFDPDILIDQEQP
jgi:hypothetical protein